MSKSRLDEILGKIDEIRGWRTEGLSMTQIAIKLRIQRNTLAEYRKKSKELDDAFEAGKEEADIQVVNALFKRALGYTYSVQKAIKVKTPIINDDGKKLGDEERIEYVNETIHVPGDVTAQIFWLCNRQPANWKRNQEPANDDENVIKNASDLMVRIKNAAKGVASQDESSSDSK